MVLCFAAASYPPPIITRPLAGMWKFTNSRKLLKSLEFGQFSPYTSGGDPFPSVLVVSHYYRGQRPQSLLWMPYFIARSAIFGCQLQERGKSSCSSDASLAMVTRSSAVQCNICDLGAHQNKPLVSSMSVLITVGHKNFINGIYLNGITTLVCSKKCLLGDIAKFPTSPLLSVSTRNST